VVTATPCLSYVVVPRADFRVARRDARVSVLENQNLADGSVSIFSQQKIGTVVLGVCPCQALNGWTVCHFYGAQGGAPTTR
jgi:hypothetical protein